MSNKKQTAVEYLIQRLGEYFPYHIGGIEMFVKQAKQIEKEQIKNAFNEGFRQGELTEIPEVNKIKDIFLFNDSENYYTET